MKLTSPGAPAVPNSTPTSARAGLRAPIHNPYDKFSQPEFDAWIGDLTGVLKRALGQEPPLPHPAKPRTTLPDLSAFEDSEDGPEDSFADFKARRAEKGKQRAVVQEDDEDNEEFEVEASILHDLDEEDEEDVSGESSHSPPEDDDSAGEYSEEEDAPFTNTVDDPIEILSSDEEEAVPRAAGRNGSHDSEEEYEVDEEDDKLLDHSHEDEADEEDEEKEDEEREAEEDGYLPEVVEEDQPEEPDVELPNVWYGPQQYAEDFYAGGPVPTGARDASRIGETDEYEGDSEEAPAEEDEEEAEDFPPVQPSSSPPPVELPDKWEGPQLYAEDFYSGGDRPQEYFSSHTPSHLTPVTRTPEENAQAEPILPGTSTEVIDVDEVEDQTELAPAPTFSMSGEPTTNMNSTESHDEDLPVSDVFHGSIPVNDSHIPPQLSTERHYLPHERSLSPARVSPTGHVDWNSPPAFKTGHPVSPTKSPGAQPPVKSIAEVVEISDDEDAHERKGEDEDELEDDDDMSLIGPPPLGTSDLDTPSQHELALDDDEEAENESLAEGPSTDFDAFAGDNSFDEFLHEHPEALLPDVETMYPPSGNEAEILPIANQEPLGEENFEPVITPGHGFGDLPSAQSASELLNVPDFLEKLVHFANTETSTASSQPGATAAFDDGPQELSSEAIEKLEQEFVGETLQGDLYSVSEPPEEVVHREMSHEVSSVVDVTDSATFADDADPVVEEVMTEGRPSQEPEIFLEVEEISSTNRQGAGSGVVQETLDVEPSSAETHTKEEKSVSHTVEDTHVASEPAANNRPEPIVDLSASVEVPDVSMSPVIAPASDDAMEVAETSPVPKQQASSSLEKSEVNGEDTQAKEPTTTNGSDADTVEAEPVTTAKPETQTQQRTPEFVLQSGIPMPVSADPNVPDPASLHDSPMNSPKPAALEESEDDSSDANTMIASAIPPNLYKNISGHRTVSGLFTPMSEASSCPPSPAIQDLSDDSAVQTAEPAPETSTENSAASPVTDETQAKDISMSPHAEGSEPVKTGTGDGTAAGEPVQVVTEASANESEEVVPTLAAGAGDSVPLSPLKNEKVDVDEDADADADGDVDPDYETSIEVQGPAVAAQLPNSAEPSPSGGVSVIPETSSVDEASVVAEVGTEEPGASSDAAKDADPQPKPIQADASREVSQATPPRSPVVSIEESAAPRSHKRKRSSPAPVIRLTRSRSSKMEDIAPLPATNGKSAKSIGKQKACEEDSEPASSPQPQHSETASRDSSRASSVALVSTDESSVESPIAQQQSVQTAPSIPLMHVHGAAPTHARIINRQPTVVGPAIPLPNKPTPPTPAPAPSTESLPAPLSTQDTLSDELTPIPEAPEPAPSDETTPILDTPPAPQAVSEPVVEKPTPPPASSTSPVTRRNCRFHKVSIPQEETNRRFYFAVPGCSLNHELMEEEDIQEHGDVMSHDILDPEVENLDPYVVGLLRQLVGVDLIRQQEVFYMPQKGEEYHSLPSEKINPRLSGIGTISARIGSSSTAPRKKARGRKWGDTISSAGSRSASVARSDHVSLRSVHSSASASDNEGSDVGSKPKAKRAKRAPSTTPSIASTSSKQTISSPRRTNVRRSRRLQPEAHAYKPSAESEEESTGEEARPKKSRTNTRRGRKRMRATNDTGHDLVEEVSKKRRRIGKLESNEVDRDEGA